MAGDVREPLLNGNLAPRTTDTAEDQDELYRELLRLREVILAGQHAELKLPATVVERLKKSVVGPDADAPAPVNGKKPLVSHAPNSLQPQQSSSHLSLPGLQQSPNGAKRYAGELDPIFLEKSDSLLRAEGVLKRRRIERELAQLLHEHRNVSQDKDLATGPNAPFGLDTDAILRRAQRLVPPISGLRATEDSAGTNNTDSYYSSKAGDVWSESSVAQGLDGPASAAAAAATALTLDFEAVDPQPPNASVNLLSNGAGKVPVAQSRPQIKVNGTARAPQLEDDDEEYTPPDASAFDTHREEVAGQTTPPDPDDDDDYEPGEIDDSSLNTPNYMPSQRSPKVPIIRNHLTHIAAPQPNRVSPLAVAKGPSYELELVNGRPEVVRKTQLVQQSRPSSSSPTNGNGTEGKRPRKYPNKKKRKREQEQSGKANKKRTRQLDNHLPRNRQADPYIKPEPVSPPPFLAADEYPPFPLPRNAKEPAAYDLVPPANPARALDAYHTVPQSSVQYEYAQPLLPPVSNKDSPAALRRPLPRDTQDLRKFAALQYAQRPPSPRQEYRQMAVSPAMPYRSTSVVPMYDPRHQTAPPAQYVRALSPSQSAGYRPDYGMEYASPHTLQPLAPPPVPPQRERRIVVDQYGNRFYAEPAPGPPAGVRASVAPQSFRHTEDVEYDRESSRMGARYSQANAVHNDPAAYRASPAPSLARQYDEDARFVQHVDPERRPVRGYAPQADPATSPVFQTPSSYDMAPPPMPTRAYSARPEERWPTMYTPQPAMMAATPYRPEAPRYEQATSGALPPPQFAPRQVSLAPAPYGGSEAMGTPRAVRAMSVLPGAEHAAQQRLHAYAPYPAAQPAVRYVDPDGREVYPGDTRRLDSAQYRFQ